jgi:2-polyprenyl-3-methyl-5-hydroxy-6-metoxy-1,4-benzoquinol methylase
MNRAMLKQVALDVVASLTARHPVLLPQTAAADSRLLDVVAPYRIEDDWLCITIRQNATGTLRATLLGYQGYALTERLWALPPIPYQGPTTLEFNLDDRTMRLGGVPCDSGTPPLAVPRRFCIHLELETNEGAVYRRVSGHYRAVRGTLASVDYFSGNNYIDYERESEETRATLLRLIAQFPFEGSALEVGCATGLTLKALAETGVRAFGVDFSEWAAKRARARVGEDAVFIADADAELPQALVDQRPFGAMILWSVLEHLADPAGALARLDRLARPGSRFFIMTANAESLCHALFGRDWEGYFDWTHRGVHLVGVSSLARWLDELGWCVERLDTSLIWSGNADPMHATVREWWIADARFRRLIEEKNLGDILTCVAVKR